jgi:GTPase SAR1 family protein
MPIVATRSSAATTKQKRCKKKQLQFLVLGAAGAGKTSLLRRFFHGQFTYRRAPTVGADFYVGKVPRCTSGAKDSDVTDTTTTGADNGMTISNPPVVGGRRKARLSESSDKYDEDDDVLVQIWDTPGKENFAMRPPRQVQTAVTMQDSFFDNADAIMLVYDMTSSTSFTRLLRWYADLIELFQRQQETTNDNNNATTTGGGKINNKRPKPILLVANKLDLFEQATNPKRVCRNATSWDCAVTFMAMTFTTSTALATIPTIVTISSSQSRQTTTTMAPIMVQRNDQTNPDDTIMEKFLHNTFWPIAWTIGRVITITSKVSLRPKMGVIPIANWYYCGVCAITCNCTKSVPLRAMA